ncbi:MAG: PVC-type heme-binding CxxCH protein [Tepidisphaeraceae bacterium]
MLLLVAAITRGGEAVVYEPASDGAGKGKHVVFLAGDEEYRSEEALPMLAKILSRRHGFKCTVLFPVDPDGTINPDNQKSLAGAEALGSADAIVMALRFRAWPDETMKHFADAYSRGVPIVALRTSTHAFRNKEGSFQKFNDFGKRVLGEQWVSHWGKHKIEATRGVTEPIAKDDAILRGVSDVFGNSDVYEAYPPADAKILLRGQVLKGMNEDDAPADYRKPRATDKQEQGVNDPAMPVAWTRVHKNEAGKENKILTTTMGAATDLQSEGLRRLVVNGVYWGLGLDVPEKADVSYVGEYRPTMYGFKGYVKGVKPSDHALAKAPATKPAGGALGGPGALLQLNESDHVSIIGNALGDRMQHHGHLETLIHAKFPKHNLTFRNLAVAGDEITTRHRSQDFGTPDEWLTKTKSDVIFAFFGFNESFKGEAGLGQFKKELDKFLKDTLAQKYNGRIAPRIVLFSPTAAERHRDPNYPDPTAMNANIALYTTAMAEVAKANGVAFVDLFGPSAAQYLAAARPLTVNGRYLTEEGDRVVALILFKSLFGESAPAGDLEKLRAAVNEKNKQWHHRYRTMDGYNVYGGRSQLSFPSGRAGAGGEEKIRNYDVMQEEMTQRDVLTANRDKLVWATARGESYVVDDSNLPPTTDVPTNKPGANPDGSHVFLGGEDAIKKMKVHAGMKVNLFASEEQFPDLVNPVQMLWDTKGRLWVSAWRNYPERTPTSKIGDKILIFEDTDRDGRADKCTTFLDDLNCPTGLQFYKDGLLLMQAPDLWFVRDTDGDGKGDTTERILMGMDSADSHHTTNSMCYEPGGATYLSDGVFHRTQVETPLGVVRNNDAAIYRFEPRTGAFETYIPYGFANPHGRLFDYWGNDIVTDATGNHTYFGPLISGRLDYPNKHRDARQFWERPSRPSPGTGMISSRHFPDEFQGNLLNLNVIGFQGIYRVKVIEDGSGLRGEKTDDLISSEDPNFRPTAVNCGPDGALYFADWHNPIIGHMQHHLRDPNRNHTHGRLYRITFEGRPLAQPPKIEGQPIAALLELLKEPENQTRELAKIELDKHDSKEVIAAVKQWATNLDKNDPKYEHHMTEALWLHQWHNVVDTELLARMLKSPEPRARAQATRVLCYWRDRVPNVMQLLAAGAIDENPRVRLEAVRTASFFRTTEAADVALSALKHPTDYYLDYVLAETIRQLKPHWRQSIADGKPVAPNNPAGMAYLVRTLDTPELLKFPRIQPVLEALLTRPNITDIERNRALNDLSEQRKVSRPLVLLDVLDGAAEPEAQATVARLLPQQLPSDLQPLKKRLTALTTGPRPALVRQYGWATLATADESFDHVWAEGSSSSSKLIDILGAVPLIYDPGTRAKAQPKVMPLLAPSLPSDVAGIAKVAKPVSGRYVRIALARHGSLSVAEIEVISDGKNVARTATATQSSMSREPERAIDGKGDTLSATRNHPGTGDDVAWLEVDLGSEQPIESVVVWNRTGRRAAKLEGFTVTVLDDARRTVFAREDNAIASASLRIDVGDENGDVRRAAIRAAASIAKDPATTFAALSVLIERGQHVPVAAAGIRALPRASWDASKSAPIADALIAWATLVPADQRTTPDYLSTVQFAENFVTLLPPDKSSAALASLRELRVPFFVIGTVREQMRYDTTRLVVEAGKPFEILFENTDFMPHNLAVVKPKSRERIGKAAMLLKPDQLDDKGRAYVPQSDDVLAATKLLENGQKETLKLTAPTTEGDYEYVCTYPDHWQVMWGKLVVTKDIDGYLKAHPDTAPAPAPTAASAAKGHDHHR